MSDIVKKDDFYTSIREILQTARGTVYKKVNFVMVEAYWNIGKQIVQEEQSGKNRAKYGSNLIKNLSKQLTKDFGKGFSQRNIRNMRQFYISFPIWQLVSAKLTWSHYILLLKLNNNEAREWYINETANSNWSVRALERQIGIFELQREIYR